MSFRWGICGGLVLSFMIGYSQSFLMRVSSEGRSFTAAPVWSEPFWPVVGNRYLALCDPVPLNNNNDCRPPSALKAILAEIDTQSNQVVWAVGIPKSVRRGHFLYRLSDGSVLLASVDWNSGKRYAMRIRPETAQVIWAYEFGMSTCASVDCPSVFVPPSYLLLFGIQGDNLFTPSPTAVVINVENGTIERVFKLLLVDPNERPFGSSLSAALALTHQAIEYDPYDDAIVLLFLAALNVDPIGMLTFIDWLNPKPVFDNANNIGIVKFKLDGTILWAKVLDSGAEDRYVGTIAVDEGRYYISNRLLDFSLWDNNQYAPLVTSLTLLSSDGERLWSKAIGHIGAIYDQSGPMLRDIDGGWLVTGYGNDNLIFGTKFDNDFVDALFNIRLSLDGTRSAFWAATDSSYVTSFSIRNNQTNQYNLPILVHLPRNLQGGDCWHHSQVRIEPLETMRDAWIQPQVISPISLEVIPLQISLIPVTAYLETVSNCSSSHSFSCP